MSIEARFYVSEIVFTAYNGDGGGKVKLTAVSRGDGNRSWAKATPGGTVELSISNADAIKQFRQWQLDGKDVALTFDAVDVAKPTDGHAWEMSRTAPNDYPQPQMCRHCGAYESAHKG